MLKYVNVVAAIVALTAASASPAWAKWGCAARGHGKTWSNNFAYNSETEARSDALKACTRAYVKANPSKTESGCRIIGCNAHLDTAKESLATWPAPSSITVKCGVKYGTKC